MLDWSEPEPNENDDEDEIFIGYFEDSEALHQQENEPTQSDPRLTMPIGIYCNLGQVDQKPIHLELHRTEIPIPPRTEKGNGLKQYKLPEPTLKVDSPSIRIKQEHRETAQSERPFESEEYSAEGVLKIVEHNDSIIFRDSSIPLSTDFAERVLPLISNPMGFAPSSMRAVANKNEIINGSTHSGTSPETNQGGQPHLPIGSKEQM